MDTCLRRGFFGGEEVPFFSSNSDKAENKLSVDLVFVGNRQCPELGCGTRWSIR